MDRRQRARRWGATWDESQPRPQQHHGPPPKRGSRQIGFTIGMGGWGTIEVLSYVPTDDEMARIDFTGLDSGRLRIEVDGQHVLDAKTAGGPASVTGLLFPAGKRVRVSFSNVMAGQPVSGTVTFEPAHIRLPEMSFAEACGILGLGPRHTPRELTVAYRKAMQRCHPDLPGGSHEKASKANIAYAILKKHHDGA